MKIKKFLLLIQIFAPLFYLILFIGGIFGSVLIIGQIAIMISGEPGNAISNLHLLDVQPPVDEEQERKSKNSQLLSTSYNGVDYEYYNTELLSFYYQCEHTAFDIPARLSCKKTKEHCLTIKDLSEKDVNPEDISKLKKNKESCYLSGWLSNSPD